MNPTGVSTLITVVLPGNDDHPKDEPTPADPQGRAYGSGEYGTGTYGTAPYAGGAPRPKKRTATQPEPPGSLVLIDLGPLGGIPGPKPGHCRPHVDGY